MKSLDYIHKPSDIFHNKREILRVSVLKMKRESCEIKRLVTVATTLSTWSGPAVLPAVFLPSPFLIRFSVLPVNAILNPRFG